MVRAILLPRHHMRLRLVRAAGTWLWRGASWLSVRRRQVASVVLALLHESVLAKLSPRRFRARHRPLPREEAVDAPAPAAADPVTWPSKEQGPGSGSSTTSAACSEVYCPTGTTTARRRASMPSTSVADALASSAVPFAAVVATGRSRPSSIPRYLTMPDDETPLYTMLMLLRTGGCIINGAFCTPEERAQAVKDKLAMVDKDGVMFVYVPRRQ